MVFTAKYISEENGSLIFNNPRIDNKPILDTTTACIEYKENILGYEICQQLKSIDIRNLLCTKLGLKFSDNTVYHGIGYHGPTRHPIAYRYNTESDQWYYLRLGSNLVSTRSYTAILNLKCRIN